MRVTKILVIEDDRDIRRLISQVLSDEGYELVFVDALDNAPADQAPDVLITDLVGVRPYASEPARAWIRRVQDRYPGTPVVVCTAHELAMKDPDQLGAAAVLPKPFAIDLLVQTVARLIGE